MLALCRKFDQSFGGALERGARIVLLSALALALLVVLALTASMLTHPYSLDYGEAVMVDQAMTVMRGENLYRPTMDAPPYTISNYPPVYVLALIPFIGLFGPSYWAGRVISLVGGAAAALFTGLTIKTLTKDRFAALVGALVLVTIPYVAFWSNLERIDSLALGLATAAIYLLVRYPDSRWGFAGGALLLVAAIYTRQSYALAAPLACFVWLWVTRSWRKAFRLAALVAGLSLLIFLLLNWTTGGGFFYNIVTATKSDFFLSTLDWNLKRYWHALAILNVLAVARALAWMWRSRNWSIAAPFLLGGFLSMLTIGKIGSNVNYFLEMCAALALAAGMLLARSAKYPTLRALVMLALAAQTIHSIKVIDRDYISDVMDRRSKSAELAELQAIVAAVDGPVLADEYMGMVTMLGKPLYIQPFSMAQLSNDGLWDQQPLLDRIANQEFPLVLIHYFPSFDVYKERWTEAMIAAIEQNYYVTDRLADTHVYRPRPSLSVEARPEITTCPGAPWRIPTGAGLGIQIAPPGYLDFFGHGNAGEIPVYAAADGLLSRPEDPPEGLIGAVIIQHDDPRGNAGKVWSVYADLRSFDGQAILISPEFAPGAKDIPVKQGQLLGYQGNWSGREMMPAWVHLRFAVLQANPDGSFPENASNRVLLDPSALLGIQVKEGSGSQMLNCR
jgi:4-amino-4-deoxy-L-arabinose transferase-like glycosyltransferase